MKQCLKQTEPFVFQELSLLSRNTFLSCVLEKEQKNILLLRAFKNSDVLYIDALLVLCLQNRLVRIISMDFKRPHQMHKIYEIFNMYGE